MDAIYTKDAVAIAAEVHSGKTTARAVTEASLARIEALNPLLNAFTEVTRERALSEADAVDQSVASGENPGPLAGVPDAVKNLFDLEGVVTLAGSKMHREQAPAAVDAAAVAKLKAAGAICLGALDMDEYAYGFTTENTHYGTTRNPHNLAHVAGGSSGGSAAAVTSGMVALALGTDTNGSIRVPAAFCGIFGLQATYGRFSRKGAFLFAESFDRIGPFTRSARDAALCFDVLQGGDVADPVCLEASLPELTPQMDSGIADLKIARAGGYFEKKGLPEVFAGVDLVAEALDVSEKVEIPDVAAARGAAYVITGTEGGNFHLHNLRKRAADFDPIVRDRFLAGCLIPSAWYLKAQKFRAIYQKAVLQIFEKYDVILAPTTPTPATRADQETMCLDGVDIPVRANIGIYTQPLSYVGLPIISVPVRRPGALPVGVMLVAAPHNEAALLRVARHLEKQGTICADTVEPDPSTAV